VLSHFARSSADLGLYESFASRQVRTTMDVACPPFLDFLHGGLHMQVTHHLFPRVPRHNLREARDRFTVPFCRKWGLDYAEYGFREGNGRVRDTLRNVAMQVRLLGKVARAQALGELH
jgi:delta8-fatty-acid desaturase